MAQAHLVHLNPFPADLGEVLRRYRKVLVPEVNLGQLSRLLRAEYLVDAISFTQVQGIPFRAAAMEAAILEQIDGHGVRLGPRRSRRRGAAHGGPGRRAPGQRKGVPTDDRPGAAPIEAPTAPVPVPLTTRKDWSSDQEVRWCPGCGDYSILAAVQMLMPELGVRRESTVFLSGIGCAARFPYYMNTYGLHSIHGRAPAIATGLAATRPDLDVWVVTGDGDALSIGGNHLIHALRRNVNITILLFNNQIYGLTKGQYSPTSEVAKVTKSTPFGSLEQPFNPLSLALGAEADVRGPHPRHGPQAHDGDVPPGPRPPGGVVRRDLPELQRLQRRGVRGRSPARSTAPTCSSRSSTASRSGSGPRASTAWCSAPTARSRSSRSPTVGESDLLVHDEHRDNPGLAFQLSRLASGPYRADPDRRLP